MKLRTILSAAAAMALSQGLHAQTYVDNGTFSMGTVGANAVSSTTNPDGSTTGAADSTTIPDFRAFNNPGTPNPNIGFNAREVNIAGISNTTTGVRLDVNNPNGDVAGAYGFDNYNDATPTTPGMMYVVTFDAALIGGTGHLQLDLQAFSTSGANPTTPIGVAIATNFFITNAASDAAGDTAGNGPYGGLQQYSVTYTAPAGANGVDIDFAPGAGFVEADAFAITDIALSVPEPGSVALVSSALAALLGFTYLKRRKAGCAAPL